MGTESLLSDYLTKTRATQTRAEASATVKRVEDIFAELELPWKRDDDKWLIQSDVGEVYAGLDDDQEVLSFWSLRFEIDKAPKKSGELFWEMLCGNAATTGACWAISVIEGSPPVALVVARISAEAVDPPEVALALSSVFRLASMG